jgi:hypothetical protein
MSRLEQTIAGLSRLQQTRRPTELELVEEAYSFSIDDSRIRACRLRDYMGDK